jgi:hypothetical protein
MARIRRVATELKMRRVIGFERAEGMIQPLFVAVTNWHNAWHTAVAPANSDVRRVGRLRGKAMGDRTPSFAVIDTGRNGDLGR